MERICTHIQNTSMQKKTKQKSFIIFVHHLCTKTSMSFFILFLISTQKNIIDREKGGKKGKAKARQCTPRVYKGNQAKRTKKGWQTKEKHHLPTTT